MQKESEDVLDLITCKIVFLFSASHEAGERQDVLKYMGTLQVAEIKLGPLNLSRLGASFVFGASPKAPIPLQ